MKQYSEIPKVITADQWDGSRSKMLSLRADFNLNFNDADHDEDGNVKKWTVFDKPNGNALVIDKGDYLIINHLGQFLTLNEKDFLATYR